MWSRVDATKQFSVGKKYQATETRSKCPRDANIGSLIYIIKIDITRINCILQCKRKLVSDKTYRQIINMH